MKVIIGFIVSAIIIILLIIAVITLTSTLINCQVNKNICRATCPDNVRINGGNNGDNGNNGNKQPTIEQPTIEQPVQEQPVQEQPIQQPIQQPVEQPIQTYEPPNRQPYQSYEPTQPSQPIEQPVEPEPSQPSQPTGNVWVKEHNRIRADVGLGPIAWNDTIAAGAQKHADTCKFEHSPNNQRQFGSKILGENLAYGSPYDGFTDKKMVDMWEDEKAFYTYPQGPSESKKGETGHYTQIVNKNVTEIGCGCAKCGRSKMCVCRYNPIQLGNQPPY